MKNNKNKASVNKAVFDPRQVRMDGYESSAEAIIKELKSINTSKMFESDSGYLKFPDYVTKIPNPVSLESIRNKIKGSNKNKNNKYSYLNDFALDTRRIFGNFFRFNYFLCDVKLRKDVSKVLFKFEDSWYKLHKDIDGKISGMHFSQPLPELKACLAAYEDIIKVFISINFSGCFY
jgi:hypothetical protein